MANAVIDKRTTNTFLPWSWSITSKDPSVAKCPSPSLVLGIYTVTTIAITGLSLVFGNRRVIHRLTFGVLGRPGSAAWKWTWLLGLGLQVSAAFLIAIIIAREPNYESTFPIWALALLLLTRPRLSFIFLSAALLLRVLWARRGRRIETDKALQEWAIGLRPSLSDELNARMDDLLRKMALERRSEESVKARIYELQNLILDGKGHVASLPVTFGTHEDFVVTQKLREEKTQELQLLEAECQELQDEMVRRQTEAEKEGRGTRKPDVKEKDIDAPLEWKELGKLIYSVQEEIKKRISCLEKQIKDLKSTGTDTSQACHTLIEERDYLSQQLMTCLERVCYPSVFSYGSSAVSAVWGEAILFLSNQYVYIMTVRFASINGYYRLHSSKSIPAATRMMQGVAVAEVALAAYYAGPFALGFAIGLAAGLAMAIFCIIWNCVRVIIRPRNATPRQDVAGNDKETVQKCAGKEYLFMLLVPLAMLIMSTWWMNWLFWIGFLHTAAEL